MAQPLSDRSASAKPVDPASVPPHLKCKACFELLINCFQTKHGYRLCQHCFATKLHPNDQSLCPGSSDTDDASERMVSQAACYPDTATRRAVSEVLVHCPNADGGCPAQVQLKHLDSHLVGACEYEFVTCTLCSCQIVRCKQYSGHLNLESDKCCAEFWDYCPRCRDTSRSLNAKNYVEHVQNNCPVVPADCKYACVGCRERAQRQHLGEHYRCCTDEHLEQTVKRLLLESEQKDRRFEEVLQAMQARLDAMEVDRSREMSKLALIEKRNQELEEQIYALRGATNDRSMVGPPTSPSHRSTPRTAGDFRQRSLQMAVLSTAAIGHESAMRSIWTVNNRISSQQLTEEPSSVAETPASGKMARLGHRRCRSLWSQLLCGAIKLQISEIRSLLGWRVRSSSDEEANEAAAGTDRQADTLLPTGVNNSHQ